MKASVLLFVCCFLSSGLADQSVLLAYQDSLGQYSFGYSAPGSARSEVRTSNGATRGTYSYIDETGKIHSAEYVADGENGFQVIATNLPQAPFPVKETPEVTAARIAHLEAHRIAATRSTLFGDAKKINVNAKLIVSERTPNEIKGGSKQTSKAVEREKWIQRENVKEIPIHREPPIDDIPVLDFIIPSYLNFVRYGIF